MFFCFWKKSPLGDQRQGSANPTNDLFLKLCPKSPYFEGKKKAEIAIFRQ
jgi:hypothetical protein